MIQKWTNTAKIIHLPNITNLVNIKTLMKLKN